MKYILTTIVCLICLQSIGQSIITPWYDNAYGERFIINGDTLKTLKEAKLAAAPKYDTVKVIMLVTDTTRQKCFRCTIQPFVNQIEGYEVRTIETKMVSRSSGVYPINIVRIEDFHTHISYLSETYGPLPKNTVVWMVKQIGGDK